MSNIHVKRIARGLLLATMLAMPACGGDDGSTGADVLPAGDVGLDVAAEGVAEVATEAGEATADDGAPDAFDVSEVAQEVVAPGKVRFVHISDLHVYGDAENPDTARLATAVQKLNAVAFDADFLVATGDYVDFLPDGLALGAPSTFTAAIDTMKALKWPVRTMAGNHEYYRNAQLETTKDKPARDAYLAAAMGHDLDVAFDLRGVRFVTMNTMQGDLWEKNTGLIGSFTDAQMTWLRQQLDTDQPTVLLIHHPPTGDALTPGGDSLCAAIQSHPGTVKAVFAGHLHGFWKGDACGVPYYLVGNTDPDKAFYFLVEVDGATGTVTVVNEADVKFGKIPEFTCDPAGSGLADPTVLVGTNQVIHAGNMISNLPGLEGFEGGGLDKLPLLLGVDSWDAQKKELRTRLSQGVPKDGFVQYMDGAVCNPIVFDVDGPCATSREVQFDLNLIPFLQALMDFTPASAWVARLQVKSLWIEAHLGDTDGLPRWENGLLHLNASGTQTLADLKGILVSEYCGGHIAACTPGTPDHPACPAAADATFFDQIPDDCDVQVGTYNLRMVLMLLAAFPVDNIVLVGELTTDSRPTATTPTPGAVDGNIFSIGAGLNCAP